MQPSHHVPIPHHDVCGSARILASWEGQRLLWCVHIRACVSTGCHLTRGVSHACPDADLLDDGSEDALEAAAEQLMRESVLAGEDDDDEADGLVRQLSWLHDVQPGRLMRRVRTSLTKRSQAWKMG